jgi:hypothetical protein
VDLGELKVPEPPLFYQAESEEIDLFLDSSSKSNADLRVPENGSSRTNATSLVGPWSGTHIHQRDGLAGILTSFSVTEQDSDGSFEGSGIDADGAFTVTGTLDGNKIDFTKSYTATYSEWRYIGTLNTETETVVGKWGPPDMEVEAAPASAIEGGTLFNRPEENTSGYSGEGQSPCVVEITVEGPTPGEEKTEEAAGDGDGDEGEDRVSQAGSALSAIRTDATERFAEGGTFSLVRRPVDYFLYRPSDTEFQENRSKALWKMVQNAAKQWYRSRHLIWDALRERRDQRNRYVELLLKQGYIGRLYDADEAAEWAKIIRQTHPNDLRLWHAIARYKEHRMISHWYVHNTSTPLSLNTDSCVTYQGHFMRQLQELH